MTCAVLFALSVHVRRGFVRPVRARVTLKLPAAPCIPPMRIYAVFTLWTQLTVGGHQRPMRSSTEMKQHPIHIESYLEGSKTTAIAAKAKEGRMFSHTVHPHLPFKYSGSSPPSVDTLWLDSGGKNELKKVHWAALKSTYAPLRALMLPPPSSPAVAPTPWATVGPPCRMPTLARQSGGIRRRRWRRRRNTTPPWRQRRPMGCRRRPAAPRDSRGSGGSGSCASAGCTDSGGTPRRRPMGSRCGAAAIRRRHREAAAVQMPPPRSAPGSCG